jgi:hypothetical protein
MNPVSLIGCGLAFYAVIGLAVGLAFVATGASRGVAGRSIAHAGRPPRDPAGCSRALALCPDPLAQGSRPDMTRSHRFAHRLIWPVLAVVVVLGLTMALALRPPPDPPAAADGKP